MDQNPGVHQDERLQEHLRDSLRDQSFNYDRAVFYVSSAFLGFSMSVFLGETGRAMAASTLLLLRASWIAFGAAICLTAASQKAGLRSLWLRLEEKPYPAWCWTQATIWLNRASFVAFLAGISCCMCALILWRP